MKEERLYQVCIVLATIGIGLIHASSIYLEPEKTQINEIERSQQGQIVRLEGNITNFHTSNGHTFFDLKDSTASIGVAEFNQERDLKENSEVEVEGKVSMHEGQMEIIAEEVTILD